MKPLMLLVLFLLTSVLFPSHLLADAAVHEWIGTYNMNHDGHLGTLEILDSKKDCATSAWCYLVIRYTDSNGAQFPASIQSISDKWQHMEFYIDFPNNHQKFDGYLFSFDKSRIAGTTYWGGRTFGFYAIKKQ